MNLKEQYWKYSLIVIILFMGVIIFRQITPFLGGLLGAFTIYILVRTQMRITDHGRNYFCIPCASRTDHLDDSKQTSRHQSGSTDIRRAHPASSRIYQRKDRIRCIREGYVVVHSLHPSTNRTTDYVKYQQSRRQSVRHDICSLLHADRR